MPPVPGEVIQTDSFWSWSRLEHRPSNDLWCWMLALPGCQNNQTKKA
jgi:hypothetical protein